MMQPNRSSKFSDSGRSPGRLLLSVGLPFLLILAFLGKQLINFDSIGWSNGFNHPLMGWDHLVTMLAVGIWAAQLRGQAIWMLPLAFVGVMSLGGLAGAAGLAVPSVEGIILLSCAVFSILITRKVRFSAKVNVLIVAFFAFFHGYAHGQEISTSASLISYTLGFMLATLLLHGAGILVAKLVVFAVASLLTIVFSNAVLAKSGDSIRENNLNAATAQALDTGLQQQLPFWTATPTWEEHEASLFRQRALTADSECRRDRLGGSSVRTGHSPADLKLLISTSHGGDNAHAHQRLAKIQPAQALVICQSRAAFDGDHLVDAGLDFKHYYRDVNHTPGKPLLSNGVGLTSPPVGSLLAPQAISKFRKFSIPPVEEHSLQLIVAKSQSGNLHTKPIKQLRQDCAFRYRSAVWQALGASLPCRNNSSAYLTPGDKSHATSVAAVVSSSNSLGASRNNLPPHIPERPPSQVLIHPNITIIINEKFEL